MSVNTIFKILIITIVLKCGFCQQNPIFKLTKNMEIPLVRNEDSSKIISKLQMYIKQEVKKEVKDALNKIESTTEDKLQDTLMNQETTGQDEHEMFEQILRGSNKASGSNTPTVAFKARRPSPDSNLIRRTLKFKTRIIDYGGGYSTTTGIFTAPVFGLYLFNLQICPENGASIHLYIKAKSGKIIGDLNSSNKSGKDGPCVSASGVEFLSQGERAWVYCTSASSSGDVVWTGNGGNSFSGILIHT